MTWQAGRRALQSLAMIVSDAQVARLIADPAVSADRVAGLIIEVAGADLGERGANFVKVLAENDRLSLLPEIATQFETLKASAEGLLEATITSAQELTQAQIDDLVAGLKAKFNRAVNVQVAVDPELIGGAVIAIGDQVIDGSVKGRLQRMAFALARLIEIIDIYRNLTVRRTHMQLNPSEISELIKAKIENFGASSEAAHPGHDRVRHRRHRPHSWFVRRDVRVK